MGTSNPLVDLMGHKDSGRQDDPLPDRCALRRPTPERQAGEWQSSPFDGHWTASVFASQDPVAIESVAVDFFAAEETAVKMVGAVDNYLHEAALAHQPPSRTRYAPAGDGTTAEQPGRARTLELSRAEAVLAESGGGARCRTGSDLAP